MLVEEYYIKDNRGEFWVVETHLGRVVGTSAFYKSNKGDESVEIRKMYLVPEMRGKGLGKALLNLIEQRIKAKGYMKVYLETASVLKEACIMYQRAGYLPTCGVETERCDIMMVKECTDIVTFK